MPELHIKVRPSGIAPQYRTGATTLLDNGPGKYELEKALFEPHGSSARRVELYIGHDVFFSATITGVEIEDGSGERFLFRGIIWGANFSSRPYQAFIRTNTRKGWLKFTAD